MRMPERLRSFVERNLPEPRPAADRLTLHQTGEMRLKPGGRAMPFSAQQWSAVDELAFCWRARVRMAPLVTAVVEDAFEAGRGRLDVRLWGAIRVMHAEGPELDRGEAQRYLAELPWNPGAVLRNPALRFEARGDEGVRVACGDAQTWVDLRFDAAGDIVGSFSETRHFGERGPTPWEGSFWDYGVLGGLRVPRQGEVSWLLPEGRFTYWRGRIDALVLGEGG